MSIFKKFSDIEQSIQDMYEKAQNLELQFLKYRLDISNKTPEQLIKEVG